MKRRNKKFKPSRQTIIIAAGAVILLYTIITLFQQQSAINAKKAELADIEARIEERQLQTRELEEILENNDDEYIIRIAREDLDLVFPGQRVYFAK